MEERKRQGEPRGASSARPCAVCPSPELGALNRRSGGRRLISGCCVDDEKNRRERMALSVVFFPVRPPAFHKSRSEILRSRSDPALDDALSEKAPASNSLPFCLGSPARLPA